jgi:FkbM family methyltransferase
MLLRTIQRLGNWPDTLFILARGLRAFRLMLMERAVHSYLRYIARKNPSLVKLIKNSMPVYLHDSVFGKTDSGVFFENLKTMSVVDLELFVKEFDGRFKMAPTSHLLKRLLMQGSYEPKWSSIFLSHVRSGADIIDVGANIGFYTIGAARKGGRVFSIEPTDGAYRRLCENIILNNVSDRVITFNGVASDIEGTQDLHFVEGMEEYSSMNKIHEPYIAGNKSNLSKVPSRTIDSLVEEHGLKPTLIKSDTEGAELMVFSGASHTLKTYRPVVMAELSDTLLAAFGTNGDQVVKIFKDLDYRVYTSSGRDLVKGSDGYGEILCLPN